jgi:prophage DNA circulation protein
MPVRVYWEDERKAIIRADVTGRWTWDDLDAGLQETLGMMDTVDHKVNFIIDIRDSHFNAGSALAHVGDAATPDTHRNEGVKVVVGANRLVKMLYSAYRKVTQSMGKDQVFHFADSIEDARAVIERNAEPV